MEKKINRTIKKIEILENPLKNLTNYIEEVCINSSVLIVCDFSSFKNCKIILEELKHTTINNIVIRVLNFNEYNLKGGNKLDEVFNETFGLIVGVGEFGLLKFVENYAVLRHILYSFVCLNNIKSEIFVKNIDIKKDLYYPPIFVLIQNKQLNTKEIFFLKLNIFKYYYLFLEYQVNINKNNDIKLFLNYYKEILSNLSNGNIVNSIVSLGLILNKYNINYFVNINKSQNDFKNFLNSTYVITIYNLIFNKINKNNLYFSRIYKNNNDKISTFINMDFDYIKFYLLSIKNNIENICKNLINCFYKFCEILKNDDFATFYNCSRFLIDDKMENIKKNKDTLFLGFLDKFAIFNF